MNFQRNFRALRLQRGMTQEALARALNVSISTIWSYERGTRRPNYEMLETIADYFNVDMNTLLGSRPGRNMPSNSTRINVYSSISPGIQSDNIRNTAGWEDIPLEWMADESEFVALKIIDNEMSPIYLEGDTVIIRVQPDCESGQVCAVFARGKDAALRRVVKQADGILLVNSAHAEFYPDQSKVSILGIVVEIRRKVLLYGNGKEKR